MVRASIMPNQLSKMPGGKKPENLVHGLGEARGGKNSDPLRNSTGARGAGGDGGKSDKQYAHGVIFYGT